MRRPPSVAPLARARHAPELVCVQTGADWASCLDAARADLRRYGDPTPTLALPSGHDPATYHWLVHGRHVAIYGCLDTLRLRRLMGALMRDGAVVAAGLGADSALHTVCASSIGAAA